MVVKPLHSSRHFTIVWCNLVALPDFQLLSKAQKIVIHISKQAKINDNQAHRSHQMIYYVTAVREKIITGSDTSNSKRQIGLEENKKTKNKRSNSSR